LALLVASAGGETTALPRVELERMTINSTFDVAVTWKRKRVQTATVAVISPKIERAGLRVGDELMSVNGRSVRSVKAAKLKDFLHTSGTAIFVFRRKVPESGEYTTIELTLAPAGDSPPAP
jgi:hypothetical protein